MQNFNVLPIKRRLQILQYLSHSEITNLKLISKAHNSAVNECALSLNDTVIKLYLPHKDYNNALRYLDEAIRIYPNPQFFLNRALIIRRLPLNKRSYDIANQNYIYAIEAVIAANNLSRELLNNIVQALPRRAADVEKILIYLANQLYTKKSTSIYIAMMADINNAFVGHLLDSYKRYISFSRSHAVSHIYVEQINLIVILLLLLRKQFPALIPDMSSFLTLSSETGNGGAVAAYVDKFEQQQATYLGAYASDDSDNEPTEPGKYPNNVTAAAMTTFGSITKGKLRPPTFTIAPQANGFRFTGNGFLDSSSEAITCWFLREHKKRLHGCVQYGYFAFDVDSTPLKNLVNNFRTLIDRSFRVSRNQAALTAINNAIKNGKRVVLDNGKIKIDGHVLAGQFFIPLFRGEAHLVDRWTPEDHKAHYYGNIINVSEAVMNTSQMGGFSGYKEFEQARQNPNSSFDIDLGKNARQLKKALIELRNTNPIVAKINGDYRLFDNMLVFLQQIYSNGIERFLPLLNYLKKTRPAIGWDNIFPNHYNPFLSFAELPEHALRYGFGDKNPYSALRARPRWRNDGLAEHPHVGICYSVLVPLAEFMGPGAPNVLRQMRAQGSVGLNIQVGPETEVSFLSYFDNNYICEKLGMKFPNFNKPYQPHYYAKYGLDPELYNLIQARIVGPNRWTNANIEAKIESSLYQWLKLFHGFNMLLKCYQEVYSKPNRDIIFLTDQPGVFSFDLPEYTANLVDPTNQKVRREAIAKHFFTNSAERLKLHIEAVNGVYENGLNFAEVNYENLKAVCNILRYPDATVSQIIARRKSLSGYTPPWTPVHELRNRTIYDYSVPSPDDLDLDTSSIFGDFEERDSSLPELEVPLGNLNLEDDDLIFDPQTGLPISPISRRSSSFFGDFEPSILFPTQPLEKTTEIFTISIAGVQKRLRKYVAYPDGNCGFYSLQLSRQHIVATLLSKLSDPHLSQQLCQVIAPEIADALIVGDFSKHLSQHIIVNMQYICASYYLFRAGMQQRIVHLKELLQQVLNPEQLQAITVMNNEQFIYWIGGQNFAGLAELQNGQVNLIQFYQNNHNALQQLITFAQNPEIVKSFIKSYLDQDQWLSFVRPFGQQAVNAPTGLIGAMVITGIIPGVCIYQQNEEGQLQLIYSCGNVADPNAKHLLYNGYNHFDALLKTTTQP